MFEVGIGVDEVEVAAQCGAQSRGLLGMDEVQPGLQNTRLSVQVQSPEREEAVERLARVCRERSPIYLALTRPTPLGLVISAALSQVV